MKLNLKKYENKMFVLIALGFALWGFGFIYKSSTIAIDGQRYYSLFDDAMISMRYAWNFSHGHGLVWNLGERVQGYTNLLMTLYMAIPALVFDKSTAVLFVQISGLVFMLLNAYLGMKIFEIIYDGLVVERIPFSKVMVFIGILAYYPLSYWTLMGMETGLLTMMLLMGVYSSFQYIASGKNIHLYTVSVFLSLAYLTRNDSLIFTLLVWLYLLSYLFPVKTTYLNVRHVIVSLTFFILIVVFQFIFQYLYYGSWLPNTYTLKLVGMPLFDRIVNGIGFVLPFLEHVIFGILFLTGFDLIVAFRKSKMLLYLLIWSSIGYQVYVGGDPWHYWRIMSPTIPCLIVLFVGVVNSIIGVIIDDDLSKNYLKGNFGITPYQLRNLLTLFVTSFVYIMLAKPYLMQILLLEKPFSAESNAENINIAVALGQVLKEDATVGVFWAGTIPYYIDNRSFDFLGKSDKHISQLPPDMSGKIAWSGMSSVPGHNKYNLDYSIRRFRPTYVQGFIWGVQDLTPFAEKNYVNVEYMGVNLYLLKDSENVNWERLFTSSP